MALVRCDHCGAPLELQGTSPRIRCLFCQHDQIVTALGLAVERPEHGGVERYEVGQSVLCEWNGKWWPATVVEAQPGSRYLVHYDGYSSSWDESVGVDRLEPRGAPSPRLASDPRPAAGTPVPRPGRAAVLAFVVAAVVLVFAGVGVAGVVLLRAPAVAPTPEAPSGVSSVAPAPGARMPFASDLTIGRPIVVEWGGRWWNASVLAVHPDGRVRVHYAGWSDRWDEDVTLDRVRIP